MRIKVVLGAAFLVALSLVISGCGSSGPVTPNNQTGETGGKQVRLEGAGSSFIFPLMTKWTAQYESVKPDVKINYQSIGSGAGIQQLSAKTINFGATDGPMTDEQLKDAGAKVLHIPATLGAVVPAYNLDVKKDIKFPGDVLADIFLGKITKWNDSKIADANPGVDLPKQDIVVVHRAEGSGTTYIFVDYLAKVSKQWKNKVGVATSVSWPTGLAAKGNEGVSGQLRQTPGSIGYVELTYALQNNIKFGSVENAAGKFIKGSPDSVSAAAAGAVDTIPDDLRVSITNTDGKDAYPISGFTWLIVYANQTNKAKGQAVADFFWWALHDGQKAANPLNYSRIPAEVVKLAEDKIKEIKYNGKTLVQE